MSTMFETQLAALAEVEIDPEVAAPPARFCMCGKKMSRYNGASKCFACQKAAVHALIAPPVRPLPGLPPPCWGANSPLNKTLIRTSGIRKVPAPASLSSQASGLPPAGRSTAKDSAGPGRKVPSQPAAILPPTIEQVSTAVALEFDVKPGELIHRRGRGRNSQTISKARAVAIYLARILAGASDDTISRSFSVHRTLAAHSSRKVIRWMMDSAALKARVERLQRQLREEVGS
jgi:hypothetical protein